MRQSIDYHIGWLLRAIRDRGLFAEFHFETIEDYAKERLHISASTTSRLIRLAANLYHHEDIEKAFLTRKISREQALLILSLEDRQNELIWLDYAIHRPTRDLREEVRRIIRIKQYDHFAQYTCALLPSLYSSHTGFPEN